MKIENKIEELLLSLKGHLVNLFGENIIQIIIYGSYAKKTYDKDSDTDIMVLLNLDDSTIRKYNRKVSEIASQLCIEYGIVPSIILQNNSEFIKYSPILPFFRNVKNEGIILYG